MHSHKSKAKFKYKSLLYWVKYKNQKHNILQFKQKKSLKWPHIRYVNVGKKS